MQKVTKNLLLFLHLFALFASLKQRTHLAAALAWARFIRGLPAKIAAQNLAYDSPDSLQHKVSFFSSGLWSPDIRLQPLSHPHRAREAAPETPDGHAGTRASTFPIHQYFGECHVRTPAPLRRYRARQYHGTIRSCALPRFALAQA
jgi:hypothetical protein